jgi:hypothetical protein
MSYSEFSLDDVKNKLGLKIQEVAEVILGVELIKPSQLLQETLTENIPLALGIDTEKARSEMIVAPVLIEIRKLYYHQISLFSGTEFNVDRTQGLNGVCDFMICHSSEQLSVNAPVFILVEAKNDNIKSGIPQCIAEMVAAAIFNIQKNNHIPSVYGAVTTGSIWKFMKLENSTIYIESTEHFIENIPLILGMLMRIIHLTRPIETI